MDILERLESRLNVEWGFARSQEVATDMIGCGEEWTALIIETEGLGDDRDETSGTAGALAQIFHERFGPAPVAICAETKANEPADATDEYFIRADLHDELPRLASFLRNG